MGGFVGIRVVSRSFLYRWEWHALYWIPGDMGDFLEYCSSAGESVYKCVGQQIPISLQDKWDGATRI